MSSRSCGFVVSFLLACLIAASASATEASADIDKALIGAASIGDEAAVSGFLNMGGDPNATDADGWSATAHAVASGSLETLETLHRKGGRFDTSVPDTSPFYIALAIGNTKALAYIFNEGLVSEKDWNSGAEFLALRGDEGTMGFLASLYGMDIDSTKPLLSRLALAGVEDSRLRPGYAPTPVLYLLASCRERNGFGVDVCYSPSGIAKTVSSFKSSRRMKHNNSSVKLSVDGDAVQIMYDQPKSSLGPSGVRRGTILFDGTLGESGVRGVAYTFRKGCDPAPYKVDGRLSATGGILTLTGRSPVREEGGCSVVAYSSSGSNTFLVFSRD